MVEGQPMETNCATGGPPEWLGAALDRAPMDVRGLLAQGIDPFAAVRSRDRAARVSVKGTITRRL